MYIICSSSNSQPHVVITPGLDKQTKIAPTAPRRTRRYFMMFQVPQLEVKLQIHPVEDINFRTWNDIQNIWHSTTFWRPANGPLPKNWPVVKFDV